MKRPKKTKQYMSEENFNLLMESLNQALEYERGERNDLRVTVLPAPQRTQQTAAKGSFKEAIIQELDGLSEASLRQVVYYVAFLKFQERFQVAATKDRAAAQAMAG